MHKPFRILLHIVFVLATAVSAHAQSIPDRVRALETTVATLTAQLRDLRESFEGLNERLVEHMRHEQTFITSVDCSAGGTIADVFNDRRAQAAVGVYIEVRGTCVENVSIMRNDVTIVGRDGATIEAPTGAVMFVTAQNTRLDFLTIRGQIAVHVRHGHLEGSQLRLIGGISATMGSVVRLYPGTVIEGSAEFGIDVRDESQLAIFECTVSGSGFDGVRVRESTFEARNCTIRDSVGTGLRVEQGANVTLDGITITSNEDGVRIGDSSILRNEIHPGVLSVTGNRSAGIRCAASPAVPQLVGVPASSVTGNPAGNFVSCPGY